MAWADDKDQTITLREGFDMMREFLERYWVQGNKGSDDIADLLGDIDFSGDNPPLDAAHWEEWRRAYRKCVSSSVGNAGAEE